MISAKHRKEQWLNGHHNTFRIFYTIFTNLSEYTILIKCFFKTFFKIFIQ